MGEYAIRKSDRAEIKIGTYETMYYLRLEDRDKVELNSRMGGVFGHYWRLPFPDEDTVLPGDYKDHNRGLRLFKTTKDHLDRPRHDDFAMPELADVPGTIQLVHECGLLVNVPCYHGIKLPELGDAKAFWNGKGHSIELMHLKAHSDGLVYPIIGCRWCREIWRVDWADVMEYIPSPMRSRLAKYVPVPVS